MDKEPTIKMKWFIQLGMSTIVILFITILVLIKTNMIISDKEAVIENLQKENCEIGDMLYHSQNSLSEREIYKDICEIERSGWKDSYFILLSMNVNRSISILCQEKLVECKKQRTIIINCTGNLPLKVNEIIIDSLIHKNG